MTLIIMLYVYRSNVKDIIHIIAYMIFIYWIQYIYNFSYIKQLPYTVCLQHMEVIFMYQQNYLLLFTPFSATRFAMHRIYANRINSRNMSRVFCDLRSQKTPRGILPMNSNNYLSPCSLRYSAFPISYRLLPSESMMTTRGISSTYNLRSASAPRSS